MRQSIDCLVRVIATALTAMPFFGMAARAETVARIGVSGNAEYSSNPFLLNTGDAGAIRSRLSISPYLEEKTARSTLSVAGDASFSAYNRRYRDSIDFSSQVGYDRRLSSQLSIRSGLSVSSSIGNGYNTNPVFETTTVPGVVPRIIDITVIGYQDRTTQAQVNAGLNYSVDDKNSISLTYDANILRYPITVNRSEYSNISQNVSYSRVINPRINAGASVAVSRVNYFGGTQGDAVIISPSLNGTFRLASRWTLSGGLGLSLSRVKLNLSRLDSTNLSGSLNLCRVDVRTNFCLNASRATAASSFDGIRTSTSAGISYSYKVNARDSFSASGGYSRSGVPKQFLGPSTDYLSATTSYSRQFANGMNGQITGGFSRSNFDGTRSSAFMSIGLNYSFGRR